MSEGRWTHRGEFVPKFPAPEPADQTRADAVLSDAEREEVWLCSCDHGIVDHSPLGCERCGCPLTTPRAYYAAVERILTARAAEHAAEVAAYERRLDHAHDHSLILTARAEAAEATVARAWGEGVQAALSRAVRQDDGITLRLDEPNPYRAALDGERP